MSVEQSVDYKYCLFLSCIKTSLFHVQMLQKMKKNLLQVIDLGNGDYCGILWSYSYSCKLSNLWWLLWQKHSFQLLVMNVSCEFVDFFRSTKLELSFFSCLKTCGLEYYLRLLCENEKPFTWSIYRLKQSSHVLTTNPTRRLKNHFC